MDSTQNRTIPQIAHLLVPQPLERNRVGRSFLTTENDRKINHVMANASAEVYNAGYRDFFTLGSGTGMATQYGEDYAEFYQVYRREENPFAPLWGVRLYRSGTVVRRTIVVSYPISGVLWLEWFIEELRAAMFFASKIYDAFDIPVDELRIISALRGCEAVPLAVRGRLGLPANEAPKTMEHLTVLPGRDPILIRRADLRDDPDGLAVEMGRLLRLKYEKAPRGL